jgi:hypothetical protein
MGIEYPSRHLYSVWGVQGEIYGIRRKMSLEYTMFEGMNQVDVLMWRGR